jgi:dihydrofolate reductase
MEVALIAAMSLNRVIGKDNKLPWHLPKDLKHFASVTAGHTVVMGNKTFNSLNRKPLSGRLNIVLTNNVGYKPDENVCKISSLEELKDCKNKVFIIGGESVYRLALEKLKVSKIYLTLIHDYYDGDSYFPEIDLSKFHCVKYETQEEKGIIFSFTELDAID